MAVAPKTPVLTPPAVNSLWKFNKTGVVYKVLMITNTTNTQYLPMSVVFQNVENSTNWSRKVAGWSNDFTLIQA